MKDLGKSGGAVRPPVRFRGGCKGNTEGPLLIRGLIRSDTVSDLAIQSKLLNDVGGL